MNLWLFLYLILAVSKSKINAKKNKTLTLFDVQPENDYFIEMQLMLGKIYHITKLKHCFAIITDSYHKDIYGGTFFRSSSKYRTNYFMEILESEDMMSPNYKTISTLKEVRKNYCDLIFLTILNGIQVQRFLKFMDEHRILNTRAKFVMLYDHRIFSRDMHFIWKKIVSVVFMRKTQKSKKGKLRFEVLTVPYPNALNDTFVAKQVNIWQGKRFILPNKIFFDKTRNLENITLKTVVLEHMPTVFRTQVDQNAYTGLEIFILTSLSRAMNFTPEFYETTSSTTEKWGRRLLNGTYTGLIGEMVNGLADVALGGIHFTPFYLDLMDLSIPHSTVCLTFLTPESSADVSWKTLILPFKSDMWGGVFASLFSVGTIFYLLSRLQMFIVNGAKRNSLKVIFKKLKTLGKRHKAKERMSKEDLLNWANNIKNSKPTVSKRKKDIFDEFSNCILLTYSMLLQVSLPRMPFNWPLRVLTGWYWIYCILVVVAYRASFTAILANPSPRITIDTLEELANSQIMVGAWGEQNKDFFSLAFDDATRKIGSKLEQVDDSNTAVDRIVKGTYAYYDNEYYLRNLRLWKNSKEGNAVLHIMKECVVYMPTSLGLEKNSPLKPTIDRYLRRLVEGGLVDKWLRDATAALKATEDPPQEALMDLKKFSSSFVALGVGYLIAIIAIIGEKIHFKYVVQKHPLYDKYNPRAYYVFIKKH